MKALRVFTDGACSGNPGPGGWAALLLFDEEAKIYSSGYRRTTNNRMELLAVIQAMEIYFDKYIWMDYGCLEICSDSAYVVNAINFRWVDRWREHNWRTNSYKWVKNYDLWKRLIRIRTLYDWAGVSLRYTKVEGHSGNEFNEMADRAARAESLKMKGKVEDEEKGEGSI